MVPSLSLASTLIVIVAGASKVAPLVGWLIVTSGAELVTLMLTADEVVAAPRLSVASAVRA